MLNLGSSGVHAKHGCAMIPRMTVKGAVGSDTAVPSQPKRHDMFHVNPLLGA